MKIIKILHLSRIKCYEITLDSGYTFTITSLGKELSAQYNIPIEEFIYAKSK